MMDTKSSSVSSPRHQSTHTRAPWLAGRRSLVVAMLMLTLVVMPAWLVFVGFEVDFLTYHPQALHSASMLRRQPSQRGATGTSSGQPRSAAATALLELGDQIMTRVGGDAYPEEIFQIDWSTQVPRSDVLHLGALQRACTVHRESVIPWQYGTLGNSATWPNALLNHTMDEQQLLAELRKCPSMDVLIPATIRGEGYCEDAAAYTKYAMARMIPRWVLEVELFDEQLNRKVTYHELCPRTPVLMLNHYWEGMRTQSTWPPSKPLYLMPNIEMFELDAKYYWDVDVVLCKTALCAQYVTMWFEQEGNPHMTLVIYTRFTTSDLGTNARVTAGLESYESEWHEQRRHKDFDKIVFTHTAGGSWLKGTKSILDCWLSRPDLPPVHFYMSDHLYNNTIDKPFGQKIRASGNVFYEPGLGATEFGLMVADSVVFLCTSYMEGYGHYINNARASGTLIVTPNVPPMSELVTPSSGVIIKARRGTRSEQFLGGASTHPHGLKNVEGFFAKFGGDEICATVDELLEKLSVEDRKRRAHRARQQFLYDTAFFAMKMDRLRRALLPAAST